MTGSTEDAKKSVKLASQRYLTTSLAINKRIWWFAFTDQSTCILIAFDFSATECLPQLHFWIVAFWNMTFLTGVPAAMRRRLQRRKCMASLKPLWPCKCFLTTNARWGEEWQDLKPFKLTHIRYFEDFLSISSSGLMEGYIITWVWFCFVDDFLLWSRRCQCSQHLQVIYFVRHGQGFHNVAGHASPANYLSWDYEDAHLTAFGWQQVGETPSNFTQKLSLSRRIVLTLAGK